MIAPWPRRLLLAPLASCLLLALACTDPPEKEMHQAQGAIEAARAAEAALKRSTDAVAERDYRQALNYALDASERAQAAAKAAAEMRAAARSEAERLLASAGGALDRARTALRTAADAKVPAAQLTAPTRAVSEAGQALDHARALVAAAEYSKARAAIAELPERLSTVASEIDAAVQARVAKRSPRRPGR